MVNDDVSTSPVILRKRATSHKHRIHTHSQSVDKSVTNDIRTSRALTPGNRSLSRSPQVAAKIDSIQFKRCRSQHRDVLLSSSSKFERLSTNINNHTRLSTFHTSTNDDEQKRSADFRRRQIYALNHVMRNLEQEQFRQFCKLHNIGTNNNENTVNNNEDTTKESLT